MEHFFSIYTFLYVPLIFSVLLKGKRQQKRMMVLWVVVFSLFRGLRWDCGTDWDWYLQSFEQLSFNNFLFYPIIERGGQIKILEQGWAFLMVLCKSIINHYCFFLCVSNCIVLSIYYKVSCLLSSNPIRIFVYILCIVTFFPVRQDLAVAVFLLGFLLFEKNLKLSVVLLVLAGFFHNSAWLMIPFTLLLKHFQGKWAAYNAVLLISLFASSVILLYIMPILTSILERVFPKMAWMLSEYSNFESDRTEEVHLSNFILNFSFLNIFCYYLINKCVNRRLCNKFKSVSLNYQLINLFVFGIVIQLLFLQVAPSLARMSSYCSFAVAILYDRMLQVTAHKRIHSALLFIFIVYMLYLYIKHFYVYPDLHFPYKYI